MSAPNDPNDRLLEAIHCGRVEPGSADANLVKALAAHAKLEALFELLRRPTQQEHDDLPTEGNSVDTPSSSGLRFRILRPHAKGGLGEVFVAMDEELHREVALKEIQARLANHPESRARFLREAEITARLEHPGIVPVYGLGRHLDGRPFYAMRLIQGKTLSEAIPQTRGRRRQETSDKKHGDDNRHLRQFVQVCNAVAYAHSRGIVHRDLKPDNIMIGPFGEVFVVDWGLAKSFDLNAVAASARESTPTQMGSIVGTPQFMSPEQAAGAVDKHGPASDIYSLGATLYYMLVREPPFPDPGVIGMEKLLEQIRKGEFLPPREVRLGIPKPLQDICLKAMALHPENRYSSASDMAREVERFLDHKPVFASVDINRIQHSGILKLTINRNGRIEYEDTVTGPVQLGRQKAHELAPCSAHRNQGRLRVIVAPQGDDSVSESHAVLEPLEHGRVRLVNLSMRLPIKLEGGHDLLAKAAIVMALPVKFSLGNNLIELNWMEKRQEQTIGDPIETSALDSPSQPIRKAIGAIALVSLALLLLWTVVVLLRHQ